MAILGIAAISGMVALIVGAIKQDIKLSFISLVLILTSLG